MKAIVVNPGIKNSVRIEDVTEPVGSGSEALLRVLRVGIDGTDLEINEGLYGEAPEHSAYLIAGHECLAVVEELPRGFSELARGSIVVPTVRRPDDCINCVTGESDMCLTGNYKEHGIKRLHGFASELALSDVNFLIKIPQELSDVAVLLEPMSVAEKGVFQAFKIQQRMVWKPSRALILGVGPLGLLTTYLLRSMGMEVFAAATRSKDSPKARLVERAGGNYINSTEQPLTSLGKFDLIMEETGAPAVAMQAQSMLNANGIMCFLGIYPQKEVCEDIGQVYTDLVLGNKTFFGSVNANKIYFEMGVQDFTRIEELFPRVLQDTITAILSPVDYAKAYNPSKDNIKSVIEFSKD